MSQVQLALAEQQSQLPMTARAAVSGIIPDSDQPQVGYIYFHPCVTCSLGTWLLACLQCVAAENDRRLAHGLEPPLSGIIIIIIFISSPPPHPPLHNCVCKSHMIHHICSTEMKYCLTENFEARVDAAGPSSFPQVVNNESEFRLTIFHFSNFI